MITGDFAYLEPKVIYFSRNEARFTSTRKREKKRELSHREYFGRYKTKLQFRGITLPETSTKNICVPLSFAQDCLRKAL